MNTQENILQAAGEAFEYANIYIEKQIDLLKLESAEKVAKSTSSILTLVVIGFLVTMVAIMFSITVGLFLGGLLASYTLAFLIVTVFYALFAVIIFVFKRQLVTNPILSMVLSAFFEQEND